MPTTATGMGTFSPVFTALSTELDTDFATNRVTFNTHSSDTAAVYIDATEGGATTVEVRIEVWDPTNGWVIVPFETGGAAMAEDYVTAGASQELRRIGLDLGKFENQMRISGRATGTADASTNLTVTIQLGSSRYPIGGNVSS